MSLKAFGHALLFGALTLIFIAVPIYGVKHELSIPNWKEGALYGMCLVTALVCGFRFKGFKKPETISEDGLIIPKEKEYFEVTFKTYKLKIEKAVQPLYLAVIIYSILYFLCCLLCQKMGLAQVLIVVGPCSSACLGLAFALFGLIIVVMNRTARSIKWGWMFFYAGMPMLFTTWFPLLAMPGIFVVFNKMLKTKKC